MNVSSRNTSHSLPHRVAAAAESRASRRTARLTHPRAVDRRIRLWQTKDADGHRTDRDFAERPFRAGEPTLTVPYPYTEPTSHADLFSWAVSTPEAGGPPAIRPLARNITQIYSPSPGNYDNWLSDSYRRAQLVKSQGSSFIATRYGLCRIRERKMDLDDISPAVLVTDIVPWGAATSYPSAFFPVVGGSGIPAPQAMTNVAAQPDSAWAHCGSGCLPLFYMDQPHPFVPARASIVRDTDRFGDSVRLKYRELKITLEEFPYYNGIDSATGRWTPAPVSSTTDTATTSFGLSPMAPRPADRVRVILFSRKKTRESSDENKHNLYVPIFPRKPSAAAVGASSTWQADMTYDTPAHGEMVFNMPSSNPDSGLIIHEDVTLSYPKYRAEDLPNHGIANNITTAGTISEHVANSSFPYRVQPFNSYGVSTPRYSGSGLGIPSSGAGSMASIDADGLPHNRRKLSFYRKFNDDGRTLRWTTGGGEDQHEMTSSRVEGYQASFVAATNGRARVFTDATDAPEIMIDMCQRELFVTVVSGAYIETREWRAAVTDEDSRIWLNSEGTQKDGTATARSVMHRAWRLSPANVCMPSLVSIKTKVWYADEPLSSIPRSITVVDATGTATGRLRVRDVGSSIGGALSADLLPLGDINPQISQLPQPPS